MNSNPSELFKGVLNLERTTHIKLLGDSITHGMGGTGFKQDGYNFVKGFSRNNDGYCWANSFKKYIERNFDSTVINNACSGVNIQFIIENFNVLVDKNDDIILCAIGTNNRHRFFINGDKPSRQELGEVFYNNLLKLHNMFLEADKKVIFIANIPASKKNEKDGADYWRILHMEDINAIYKVAAEKCGFPFISMYDLFTEYCEMNNTTVDSLLQDGVHPNNDGHTVFYNLLLKVLKLN